MDILGEIESRLLKVPEPETYYKGTAETDFFIPENVIVAARHAKRYPARASGNLHYRFLLAINLEGDGEAVLDYVRYKLPAMHCLLIFPYQYHHFSFPKDIKWIFITFEKKEYRELETLRGRISKLNERTLEYLRLVLNAYIGANLKRKAEAARIVLFTSLILNEIMISEFLGLPEMLNIVQSHEKALVDRINKFLAMNISRHVSVDELAGKFSYSPSRLRAVYKKTMGISMGKYAKELRLLNARKLLSSTSMRIGDIASKCGYESLYSFSRVFKDATGISPKAYRYGAL